MAGKIIDRGFQRAVNAGLLHPRLPFPRMPTPALPAALQTALTMLPSCEAPLASVLFALTPQLLEDNDEPVRLRAKACYLGFFASLPKHCRIVVLAEPSTVPQARDWLAAAGIAPPRGRVIPTSPNLDFTFWTCDPFWTCIPKNKPLGAKHLVEPKVFPRASDEKIADDLRSSVPLKHRIIDRRFEGGNMLVGDHFWLVGIDTVQDLGTSSSAVKQAYRGLEHVRKPIVVGRATTVTFPPDEWFETVDGVTLTAVSPPHAPETRQPIFHIDMFITLVGRQGPAGEFTVLVGDPSLATATLGRKTWPDDVVPDPSLQKAFDDTAAELVAAGFHVVRNPLPLVYDDNLTGTPPTRKYYFASYNNAVVQRGPKRVLLPTYADAEWPELALTDAENVRIWKEVLGFDVVPLPEMNAFAFAGGAANCIKNVLARGLVLPGQIVPGPLPVPMPFG